MAENWNLQELQKIPGPGLGESGVRGWRAQPERPAGVPLPAPRGPPMHLVMRVRCVLPTRAASINGYSLNPAHPDAGPATTRHTAWALQCIFCTCRDPHSLHLMSHSHPSSVSAPSGFFNLKNFLTRSELGRCVTLRSEALQDQSAPPPEAIARAGAKHQSCKSISALF